MLVNKIRNISSHFINIVLKDGNSVVLGPGDMVKNTDVKNLDEIKSLVNIEYNLSEVNPLVEGKQYLKG
jgi:hypothetical protein